MILSLRRMGFRFAMLLLVSMAPLTAAVTITSILPDAGAPAGGTAITINGTGFQSGATVTIGGVPATAVFFASSGIITCTTPAGTLGSQPLVLTNPDTSSQSASFTYTNAPAPTLSGISPPAYPPTGGSTITITGANFVSGATVDISGNPASSVTVVDPGTITCVTPAVPVGAGSLVVTNPDTQLAYVPQTFSAAPTVSLVAPASGPVAGGTAITITGTGFLVGATVTVGGNPASSVVVTSATTITCTTAAGAAGPATAVVANPDTQSASGPFTYQGSGPAISAVDPALAPASGGTALTITGTGFLGSTVTIGGAPATAVVVVSPSTISCVSPAGTPGPANVVVTNSDLTSAQTGTGGDAFVYQGPPPTITSITPAWGPAGTRIAISGTNVMPGAQVFVDRVPADGVAIVDAQTVTCAIPAGVAGFVTITVTNPDFTSAIAVDGFNVVGPTDLSAHHCGGGHGFSTLLLAPFIAWRLLAPAARRRRGAGAPPPPA